MKVNKSQERLISGLLAGPVREQRKRGPKCASRSKARQRNAAEVAGAEKAAPPLSPAEPLPLPLPLPAVSIGADGSVSIDQTSVVDFSYAVPDAASPTTSAPFLERVAARHGEWRDADAATVPATRSAADAIDAKVPRENAEVLQAVAVDGTVVCDSDRDG